MSGGAVVVIGGTAGIGLEVARHYSDLGQPVIITGSQADRASQAAAQLGNGVQPLAFDLAQPEAIVDALRGVGAVSRLVLSAVARDHNPIRDYTVAEAVHLTTMKLVGYTATVSALTDRFTDDSSVVLFGGQSKERPFPGSTTVTAVNGGVTSLIRTMAIELAPVRFNAIHPGIVGDSPYWSGKPLDAVISRTPTGRLVTMSEVVDATVFLLENRAINGVNLPIDGGWLLT